MPIRWDPLKSQWLKRTRGVSFGEILSASFIAVEQHPKRLHQKLLLFEFGGYIWTVPCVRHGSDIFLKTAFPSREYTKKWVRGELK